MEIVFCFVLHCSACTVLHCICSVCVRVCVCVCMLGRVISALKKIIISKSKL